MRRPAPLLLTLHLLAASITANVWGAPGDPTPPERRVAGTSRPAVAVATKAVLGGLAAALLFAPEAQAALQADVIPAATNATAAAAAAARDGWASVQGWWTSAQGAGSAAWNHATSAGNAAVEVFRPATDQAATLLSNAADYARRHPEFAAADVAAGTAVAAGAGLAGKGLKWGLGLGLLAVVLGPAGWVEPEGVRSAFDHVVGATANVTRQALEALRDAPWYERAYAETGAFCSRWGRHALDHLGMTTTFGAAGWGRPKGHRPPLSCAEGQPQTLTRTRPTGRGLWPRQTRARAIVRRSAARG
ncbi:MAG: hypothetical protein IPG96_02870 [Proteobacteria bacterium]|nr:hypothetical protein [Pseudomonadota bacterium]